MINGAVVKYGDNIDTDVIIPGKYTKTLDLQELARHAMEDIDPDFGKKIRSGGIIAAGSNFGCGSSREQAPLALLHSGVCLIAAKSYARIFYRNAINVGLLLLEADTDQINDGDRIEYEMTGSYIKNLSRGIQVNVVQPSKIMFDILESGGLVDYLKKNHNYKI